jgi:hypothetical protein
LSDNFRKYIPYEFSGKGKVILDDSADITANFQIYQLNPGNLVGSLFFTKFNSKLNDVINFKKTFRFHGETANGLKISAERCAVYSTDFRQDDTLPDPLIISRFLISILKVYNNNNLDNLENEGITLCFEIGVLNYYSTANFLVNTEIGEIQSVNRLTNDDINIFRNLHIPNNTTLLRLKVKNEKTIEVTKEKIFKVVDKVLELTSFALCTEIRWSYYSVFLNEFSGSQLAFYESQSRLPITPNPHYNIKDNRITEFLNKSYNNYTDQLITKYNFSVALKWYLDSMALRYEVMKFISASTSLESILDSFSTESETVLPKEKFNEIGKKIEPIIKNEIGNQIPAEDVESILLRISEINRRSYRKKAVRLLESLEILDDDTRKLLKEIIEVRDSITHSGRFVDPMDKTKAAKSYFELTSILTKVFLRILVPDDDTFYQQYARPWKLVD